MRRVPPTFLASVAAGLALLTASPGYTAPEAIPCDAEPTDMTVAYGDVVTCELEADVDSDLFRFEGVAGEKVLLFASGSSGPCLELIKPDGEQLLACVGFANRMDLTLDQTGTHVVRIDGIFAGPYTFLTERVIPPSRDVVPVTYGEVVQDDLDPEGDFDLFVFRGSSGDVITIDATGSVSPCIELVRPDDSRQSACGFSARIDDTLPQDGIYAILSNGSFGGTYELSVQCLLGPCVPASAACTADVECDDGNACTADACSPTDSLADALGCIHDPIADCAPPDECAGKPDLTPCGVAVGNCQPACCCGRCGSDLLCEQTSSNPTENDKIAVDCQRTASGTKESCRAQGFAEEPPLEPLLAGQRSMGSPRFTRSCPAQGFAEERPPQTLLAGPEGQRQVTRRGKTRIKRSKNRAGFKLKLNDYGKGLLEKARERGQSLAVTVVIQRRTDGNQSLLTQTVTLE